MKRIVAIAGLGLGLLAGCAQAPLASGSSPTVGASAPPPSAASPAPAVAGQPLPDGVTLADAERVDFADATHGYAIVGTCPGASDCAAWVAVTGDGGSTWTGSQVGLGLDLGIFAFDATHALITGDETWLTTDGGVSWAQLPAATATVATIPTGAFLVADSTRLRIINPDGSQATLATPLPGSVQGASEFTSAADGGLWALTGGNLALSRDHGLTWTTVVPPVAVDDARLLAAQGIVYFVDPLGYRVWRTTDNGAQWQQLVLPWGPGMDPTTLKAAVDPDGRIVIYDDLQPGVYAATATQRVFAPAANPAVPASAGRVVRVDLDDYGQATGYSTTADGVTWTPLPFAPAQ